MAEVTVEELLEKVAACKDCGKRHEYRLIGPRHGSWADDDGHGYRPVVEVGIVAQLRYLATGRYVDPWLLPERTMAAKIASAIGRTALCRACWG